MSSMGSQVPVTVNTSSNFELEEENKTPENFDRPSEDSIDEGRDPASMLVENLSTVSLTEGEH